MKWIKWLIGVIGVVVVLTAVFSPVTTYYNTKSYTTGVVTDKYVKEHKYYVVIDETAYKNQDDLVVGKWNSADVQAKLKVGDKVYIKTVGYRNEFFSVFPNVVEVRNDK